MTASTPASTERYDLSFLEVRPSVPLSIFAHGGVFRAVGLRSECVAHNSITCADATHPLHAAELALTVNLLPLGEGYSIQSAARKFPLLGKVLQRILNAGGNHLLRLGADLSIGVGWASAYATLMSPQAQQSIEKSYTQFAATIGGSPPVADSVSVFGTGGTSTGGGQYAEQALLAPFRCHVAELSVERLLTGPTLNSFLSRPGKLVANCVALLASSIGWHRTLCAENPNEIRSLTLTDFELARTEEEKQYRVGAYCQAQYCEEVRRHRAVFRNLIADNSAGRIAVVRHGFFGRIIAKKITSEARHAYLGELKDLKRAGAQPLAIEEALRLIPAGRVNGNAMSFASLMKTVEKLAGSKEKHAEKLRLFRTLLNETAVSPKTFAIGGAIKLVGLNPLELDKLIVGLDRLGGGYQGFILRRRVVQTLINELERVLSELKLAAERQKRSLARRIAWLGWTLVWLAAATGLLVAKFLVLATPPKLRSRLLQSAFKQVVRAALAFAELTAAIAFVTGLLVTLRSERQRLENQLDNAIASLGTDAMDESGPWLVEMWEMEVAWKALRQLRPEQAVLNQDALTRLVKHVNARGLQEILGARDAHPETLCEAAFATEPTWGPAWGNRQNWATDDEFVVLPAVSAELRNSLRDAATQQGKKLFFADRATYSTALKFRISVPSPFEAGALDELVSGALRTAFGRTVGTGFEDFYPEPESRKAARWVAEELKIQPTDEFLAACDADKNQECEASESTIASTSSASQLPNLTEMRAKAQSVETNGKAAEFAKQ